MIQRSFRAMARLQAPIWLVLPMLALTLVLGFGGGYLSALGATNPCPESPEVCASFGNFWKSWDLVSKNYVDPSAVQPQKMVDGAIEGMLDSLGDRGHTRYLSAETAKAERESLSGRFEGIGAYIDVRDQQPVIVQPIEGSPAEKAGIQAGDLILKVDGQDMYGVTIDELRNRVRGPKGSKVTLTLRHEDQAEPYDVTVTRDEIMVPSVSWRMLSDKVAHIHLNQFSSLAPDQMKQALKEAESQGARAIVLDLRNNPGGLVNSLVDIAGQFLPKDSVVLLEQDRDGQRTPYKTRDDAIAPKLPMVVLVNNNSASSAEILAAALKENGRARVVGTPTFGTATVLRPFDLDGGAQLRIGTTQWLTPKGEEVRGKGITPDDIVELPPQVQPLTPREASQLSTSELESAKDTQLARAIDVLSGTAQR